MKSILVDHTDDYIRRLYRRVYSSIILTSISVDYIDEYTRQSYWRVYPSIIPTSILVNHTDEYMRRLYWRVYSSKTANWLNCFFYYLLWFNTSFVLCCKLIVSRPFLRFLPHPPCKNSRRCVRTFIAKSWPRVVRHNSQLLKVCNVIERYLGGNVSWNPLMSRRNMNSY